MYFKYIYKKYPLWGGGDWKNKLHKKKGDILNVEVGETYIKNKKWSDKAGRTRSNFEVDEWKESSAGPHR